MADPNLRQLIELSKESGNNVCADCEDPDPEWASHNIGVFICTNCAGIHRNMGSHISKVKSIKLDKWSPDQIQRMSDVGNLKAKKQYEVNVQLFYRRPTSKDCQVLREQWIRAKYEREEFIYPEKQIYTFNVLEFFLWKRGKDDDKFLLRKFVMNQAKNTLVYFVKEHKDPKAIMRISDVNATFVPEKLGHPNAVQLSFFIQGSTRHIFVYSEDGKEVVDFYMAIRSAKFTRLQVAFPGANETELASRLTHDFIKEGYVHKTGPKSSDGYKKRWFTLNERILQYFENPVDAYPRGEIFLGYRSDGYKVLCGVPPGSRDQGFSFTLKTPNRSYLLSTDTLTERTEWIAALDGVISRPMTPQDNSRK